MCKGIVGLNQLLTHQSRSNIWLALYDQNNNQIAATTFNFLFSDNENCITGIKIYTFCTSTNAPHGTGRKFLMEIILGLFFVLIDDGHMYSHDGNYSYIVLNPTPESKPFYEKLGFIYDNTNGINTCYYRTENNLICPDINYESDSDMMKKYLKYKKKYLKLKLIKHKKNEN